MMIAVCLLLLCVLCARACEFEGCEHVDYGSCGTACCRLNLMILNETPEQVMRKLNLTIAHKGPDSRYIGMRTAGGNMTFTDLISSEIDFLPVFLGQTWHTTKNLQYNDTINLLIKKEGAVNTRIFAVSVSQIAGAYGDAGQNYFNIKQLFDAVKWDETYQMNNIDESCPLESSGRPSSRALWDHYFQHTVLADFMPQ
ncbi:hypothetical protein B484DRAFT_454636 [Ochromonadaceae sp. CCMP2298]|nr:hypothetical protein B484DRAFT_454636 [Ochromonadaceae sp. CCMP2298]